MAGRRQLHSPSRPPERPAGSSRWLAEPGEWRCSPLAHRLAGKTRLSSLTSAMISLPKIQARYLEWRDIAAELLKNLGTASRSRLPCTFEGNRARGPKERHRLAGPCPPAVFYTRPGCRPQPRHPDNPSRQFLPVPCTASPRQPLIQYFAGLATDHPPSPSLRLPARWPCRAPSSK